MRKIQTTGDPGIDREFDALWQAIEALKPAAAGLPVVPDGVTPNTVQGQSSVIVQDVAAATILTVMGLEFDTADGFGVSQDTTTGLARIDFSPTFGTIGGQIDIADTASDGVATTAARSDHQHAFPAPSTGYPTEIAATEVDGTASTPARSDHVHRGMHSLAKNGSSALYGDVTLTGGTNVTLTQSGQDISIAAASGSSGPTWDFAKTDTSVALTADTTKIYVRVVYNDGSGGYVNVNITLPDPAVHTGVPVFVKSTDNGSATSKVKRYGSEKIDNVASDLTLHSGGSNNGFVALYSDGTNWWSFSLFV